MKNSAWFAVLAALILTATVALADASFAQPWGQGMGCRGQGGGQTWGQSRGPGYANCPNYPGYRHRLQGGQNYPQVQRGRRWNQAVNPPSPPNPVPEVAQ